MCNEFYEALSLYFDGELDEAGINEMLDHIKECDDCRRAYEDYEKMRSAFESIKDEPLPEGGHEKIMEGVRGMKKESKFGKFALKFNKKFAVTAAVIVVAFIAVVAVGGRLFGARSSDQSYSGAGNGYSYSSEKSMAAPTEAPAEDYYYDEEVAFETEAVEAEEAYDMKADSGLKANAAADAEQSRNASSDRMIIKNLSARLEVESFDETVSKLQNIAKAYGGYVQDSYAWEDNYGDYTTKNGNITLRIPKEHYESVKSGIEALGDVKEENETSTDVTSQYVETEGRLTALRTEQDRLLEILGKCETVEDLITVESRLSEVRASIEIYQNMLNNWDRLVQLSTVTLEINEKSRAKVYTQPKFGERVGDGFIYGLNNLVNGWQDFVVWLAENVFGLIILVVIIIIIVKILKRIFRKRKEKAERAADGGEGDVNNFNKAENKEDLK